MGRALRTRFSSALRDKEVPRAPRRGTRSGRPASVVLRRRLTIALRESASDAMRAETRAPRPGQERRSWRPARSSRVKAGVV
jgi:hypothetical protein